MGSLNSDPHGDQIAVTSLDTIHLNLLELKDPTEVNRLLAVCTSFGFFYLDFTSSGAENLPSAKRELLNVMKEYLSRFEKGVT